MVDVVADAVSVGAPRVGSSSQAVELIGVVERARRLMAVSAVDVLDQIHTTGSFYEHGHANARVMFAHVAGVSGTESHRLDQIRRMISEAEHIAKVWRQADLSVDKAVLLGRAFANPRTRHRFLLDQVWLLKQARRDSVKRFTRTIARWVELHDVDGTNPGADPSFERRNAWLSQDHFSKTWKLDAELGSIQGSLFNQTLDAYIEAEFAKDWAEAEKLHGTDVCTALLARTNAQRSADALCQIAADAINSNKPSAPVKRVHNICWTAETFEELCRRWTSAPAQPLDPGTYNISDLDGNPIEATAAFADSLVSSIRRVVRSTANVTINMGTETRLFTGLARLGVQLTATECYWPGCDIPTSKCQIDHLKPAARGGKTDQQNAFPACKNHNRLKENGYTVTREPDGTITITTPNGDTLQ